MKRTRTKQLVVAAAAVLAIVGLNATAWWLAGHELEATLLADGERVCVASVWTAVSQVVHLASFVGALLAVVAAVVVGPTRKRRPRPKAPRWLAARSPWRGSTSGPP